MGERREKPKIEEIRARIAMAKERVGSDGWLLGYDANGIQQFVTATNRPKVIRGASEAIRRFDDRVRARDVCIFAGGARGLLLLPSEADPTAVAQELTRDYGAITFGEVLSTTKSPYVAARERDSLALFREVAANAKDEAPPPSRSWLPDVPDAKGTKKRCGACSVRQGVHPSNIADDDSLRCERCHRLWESMDGKESLGESLGDLSRTKRYAVVSADGNEMGVFFNGIDALEGLACASEVVEWIFQDALDAALEYAKADRSEFVKATVGGDDVRVFLNPQRLPAFITGLFAQIKQRCDDAKVYRPLLKNSVDALERVGIGVGALVVHDHYPSGWAQERAHELEVSAKRWCKAERGRRFGVELRFVSSGEELSEGFDRGPGEVLGDEAFSSVVEKARTLTRVPRTQRSRLAEANASLGEQEVANLFRYQVARHQAWRAYLGDGWANAPDAASMPRPLEYDLARLMDRSEAP